MTAKIIKCMCHRLFELGRAKKLTKGASRWNDSSFALLFCLSRNQHEMISEDYKTQENQVQSPTKNIRYPKEKVNQKLDGKCLEV